MKQLGRVLRRVILAAVLAGSVLVLPDAAPHHARYSLVQVEAAKAVDFESGVVWFLLLGSDSRTGDLRQGRADGIQLVGLDFGTGSAVAFGVPRDSWVTIPGYGPGRINEGLPRGGPDMMSDLVAELFGITPNYVLTTDLVGLGHLIQTIGGELAVDSPRAVVASGVTVREGRNVLDERETIAFVRERREFGSGDMVRSANHQQVMRGFLRALRSGEDEGRFVERAVATALWEVETDLSPLELYRLAQAVTLVEPSRVQACVLTGTFVEVGALQVVDLDEDQAQRLGQDARADARLDRGCLD